MKRLTIFCCLSFVAVFKVSNCERGCFFDLLDLSRLDTCSDENGHTLSEFSVRQARHSTFCTYRRCEILCHIECKNGNWVDLDGNTEETKLNENCEDKPIEMKSVKRKKRWWGRRRSPPPPPPPPPPPANCGQPPVFTGATASAASTLQGAIATYTCSFVYMYSIGPMTLTCQSNGQWSGQTSACYLCPDITQCLHRRCTNPHDVYCMECYENNAIFKRENGDTECLRMCAWNNHYCWPGTCGGGLAENCVCASGFTKIYVEDVSAINAGETSCQLDGKTLPDLLTCNTVAVGVNGEKKRALSPGTSTSCPFLQDMYGNFQPVKMEIEFTSEFTVNISSYASSRPSFIKEENFGISDTMVTLKLKAISGAYSDLSLHPLLTDTTSSSSVKQTNHDLINITVSDHKYNLQNGEALCVEFISKAGGYLKSIDTRGADHLISDYVPYTKVAQSRTLCYRYDNAAPEHCSQLGSCTSEPLRLHKRITRIPSTRVEFIGWVDPIPNGGETTQASSVESFQITVNEVPPSKGPLKVDYNKNVLSQKVGHNIQHIDLNLAVTEPRLYCITLEVKDVADNVKQARRFMLVDGTSYIETWNERPFIFSTASPATQFQWQTHHNNICLTWTDHFVNMFYYNNNLLKEIESDPHGHISGIYDQNTGSLPVSGTPNVHGIMAYYVSWNNSDGEVSLEHPVSNFQNQSYCATPAISDGQTYTFTIRPVDIMNNTINESRTLHIDSTYPHINNIWLTKEGYEMLYVHSDIDLSTMTLSFEALDPHSGLHTIEWLFGIADTSTELTRGHTSIGRTQNKSCPHDSNMCYCPAVGYCEVNLYTIQLNSLIGLNKHNGDHNRNYYFTLTVTNQAMLSTTERIDILVDDSPPEKGVVYEGPVDNVDIDYTSEDSFLVHWHGFIDHESGIKFYKIGLAQRCLKTNDFLNSSHDALYFELPNTETSIRLFANFTGKRFVTVVAINNAIEASKPACSDGITRDLTPPQIRNVTLQHATWSETITCINGMPYLLTAHMDKQPLFNNTACSSICTTNSTISPIADYLQTKLAASTNSDTAEFLCKTLNLYTDQTVIFLPNDYIFMQWDIENGNSQIEDFYVGFGSDPTEREYPNILDYKSSDRKLNFRHQHEAIGSTELFYIFIKAVNKAGITSVATLGPILIDETPPLWRSIPNVSIDGEKVVFGWEAGTFFDEEQTGPINQIVFQFLHGENAVSPLLEWRLEASDPCPPFSGGCIKYPITNLHYQDVGYELPFYLMVHVYNNAGHSATAMTSEFVVPSIYPPGHGIIVDLDPENSDVFSDDVDIHFTENVMCARWTGFSHTEHVSFEAGIGTIGESDNILAFGNVQKGTNMYCLNSKSIIANAHLVFLVRVNGTGGSNIAVSNGLRIYNQDILQKSMKIRVGRDCFHFQPVIMTISNTQTKYEMTHSLIIGQRYSLYLDDYDIRNVLNIGTNDGLLDSGDQCYFLTPFTDNPYLNVTFVNATKSSLRLKVNQCPRDDIIQMTNLIDLSWKIDSIDSDSRLQYSVAIAEVPNVNLKVLNHIMPFQTPVWTMSTTLHNVEIKEQKEYVACVKVCSNSRCLDFIQSKPFTVELSVPHAMGLSAVLKTNEIYGCLELKVSWDLMNDDFKPAFYQWTLSRDEEGNDQLLKWENVIANASNNKVKRCVSLPIHGHAMSFLCVRMFSLTGHSSISCVKAMNQDLGAYSLNAVYDFDASDSSWYDAKKLLESLDIGKHYSFLHNAELDFGFANSSIAGAMLYASNRNVTWYLMTVRRVPSVCDTYSYCHAFFTTNTGFVEFKHNDINMNTFYYICAQSDDIAIQREFSEEYLAEISSCSNGFILDDAPPSKGEIQINHHNRYITNPRNIVVTWNGFDDNVDASVLGYQGKLKNYYIAIGTRPGSDDIASSTKPGYESLAVLRLPEWTEGRMVYATVTGTDYAGFSTVSESLKLTIDTTPPIAGRAIILDNLHTSVYVGTMFITIRFDSFYDPESGIGYFQVGLGSKEGFTDMIPLTKIYENTVEWNLGDYDLHNGHKIFLTTLAVNRAGLVSTPVNQLLIIDQTPPTNGHVLDGLSKVKDSDYQQDVTVISANWKDFYDSESGLAFYRVGLGTVPYDDNERIMTHVELMTEVSWNAKFVAGKIYFVTVEACNNVNLCTIRTSDGITLDNSPPTTGVVYVGVEGNTRYVGQISSINIRWHGFEDPQSDIAHFEVCISSETGHCDIVERFNALLHSSVLKTNITLPVNTPLVTTVIAINNAGLNASKDSDSWFVDDTPPYITLLPKFILDYNAVQAKSGQWEKSIIRLEWMFDDDESPVVRHEIALKTHHEGHTPMEHLVLGSERQVTIALDGNNWLHDGDSYYAIVTGCNAAGHCSSSRTPDLLVDSTPPHLGGFKAPMTWKKFRDYRGITITNVSLTWYGFYDQESDIEAYYITMSRKYSGQELSNGVVTIQNDGHGREIQTSIFITEQLLPNEKIILSLWAQNNVGLNSSVARVSVNVLQSSSSHEVENDWGPLEIEKHSCVVHYCNNDCTCAIVGRPCADSNTILECIDISNTEALLDDRPTFTVSAGLKHQSLSISASSACLAGHWVLNKRGKLNNTVERFEWSIGMYEHVVGEGVFDVQSKTPWHDIGLRWEFVHCLPINKSFLHDEKYVVYLKVWYGPTAFAVFSSSPVIIDLTPPIINRGKFIMEGASCIKDEDFLQWTDNITICWKGVFSDLQSGIHHYSISVGTAPERDDTYSIRDVGLATNITLKDIRLQHGTRYFVTVYAVNNVGLHLVKSSDGFIVDKDKPQKGIVFNSMNHNNLEFQSSSNTFMFSWHGFQDHFSGIQRYLVAFSESNSLKEPDLRYTDVGLQTQHTFSNLTLHTGKSYIGIVKAEDAAGHQSEFVTSPKVTIDTSPPTGYECESTERLEDKWTILHTTGLQSMSVQHNLFEGKLYYIQGNITGIQNEIYTLIYINTSVRHVPLGRRIDSMYEIIYSFISPATGQSSITIDLGINISSNPFRNIAIMVCKKMTISDTAALVARQFDPFAVAVFWNIDDQESNLKMIKLGAGTTEGGLQLQPLMAVHTRKNNFVIRTSFRHNTPLFITMVAENHAGLTSVFRLSSPTVIDQTSPIVTSLETRVIVEATNVPETHDHVRISTVWEVEDLESDVKFCTCALGHAPFLDDIMSSFDSQTVRSCFADDVKQAHNSKVYVTIKCYNNAHLCTTVVSEPVTVFLQPPDMSSATVQYLPMNEQQIASDFVGLNGFPVQTNNTCLLLEWSKFGDISEIMSYAYRIHVNGTLLQDWTNIPLKTMLSIQHLDLKSNTIITAEIKAVNVGQFTSESITTLIQVHNLAPPLTGNPASITRINDTLLLDWADVFNTDPHIPHRYGLIIGSRDGHTDIADVAHLSKHVYEVIIPSFTLVSPVVDELFVRIVCTYSTGLSSMYKTKFII